MDRQESPAAGGGHAAGKTARESADCTATSLAVQPTPRKWQRVLQAFIDRGEQGWNRFESARELRDHVLPTTVAQLQGRGVRILRRTETVPGFMGAPTDCARYWLDPESLPRAQELLGLPPAEPRVAA